MIIKEYLQYVFWYRVSHYHCVRLNEVMEKLTPTVRKNGGDEFWKLIRKSIKHSRRFLEIQKKLDALKEEICKKCPELRD